MLNFAIERSKLTGLPLDRQGGSVAAFDFLYLPRLHREGFVGHDTGAVSDPVTSPGGYVMDSKPGLLAVAWASSNTKNTRSRIIKTNRIFSQYFFKEVIITVSPENWLPT